LKFANITEEGVIFRHPDNPKQELVLRPEDSIRHQNNIGADIIMMLDDVISSTSTSHARFKEATYRTVRWLDRCYASHKKKDKQSLFPIVQGGLDTDLRDICLKEFYKRDLNIPGYAIGGLAGGEEKEKFFKIVDFCCKALPDLKPRYLMGVGYPLDIVLCTALGVDMYDCVYPTRTARFGTALVHEAYPGTLRLKSSCFHNDHRPISSSCNCQACHNITYTRAQLHFMLKGSNETLAVQLMTHHNLAFMMNLMKNIREAILLNQYQQFVHDFVKVMFPHIVQNKIKDIEIDSTYHKNVEKVLCWVKYALELAGMPL